MEKVEITLLFSALLLGLLLVGCVQNAQPTPHPTSTPTPYPTSTPTVSPTVQPTATPEPSVEPVKNALEVERLNQTTLEPEDATLRVLTPDSFALTAAIWAGTPCSESTAYWTSTEGEVDVHFEHAQPAGIMCIQVLESRTFSATLNFSAISWAAPLKKIKVFNNGGLVKEFDFDEMFCGGIAAFQCPRSFECVLDGSYPDAGGKCKYSGQSASAIPVSVGQKFNITLESNPTTGYDWNASIENGTVVGYLGSACIGCGNDAGIVGAGHNFSYQFEALAPGKTRITMEYKRAWEQGSTIKIAEFEVEVK